MTSIPHWLEGLGLGKYSATFAEAEIEFDVLPDLTDGELEKLGIPLGPRKRLLRAIASLGTGDSAPKTPHLPSAPHAEAGRRQLSVLFADLVGSTELSQKLDPEDLREVMQAYQSGVTAAVRDAGGFLAKYMGDGVLAYFGYPQAREDAAERAVHAGLAVVTATKGLALVNGQSLAVRVGVATGAVVVGDVIGDDLAREVNVVGETPNLAARLLGIAAPNQVVIADSTRHLVGDLFRLDALGAQALKGINAPILAWSVLGIRPVISRFEAVRKARQSQFVGRGQEVGLLQDRWDHAASGEGQLVLLSGEAGIGKSRIIDAFFERLATKPHYRIRYQCSPQHVNSPLYPVITQLTYAAGIAPEDDAADRAAKIAALLGAASSDHVALIANLVGVPLPEGSHLGELEPARRRQATLEALVDQLDTLACHRPVLLLLEDAHWIDPSTQDLIAIAVDRAARLPLLIVVTFRPEYEAPWVADPIATQLALNRLPRAQVTALLASLAPGKALPPEAIEHIAARSDGIPLYVEEMFGALRDSGVLAETESDYHLARPLHDAAVPATLQDSLMARLDRVAPAKLVAQVGAVIGREFEHSLLVAAAGVEVEALQKGIADLIASGLVFARGKPPEATYSFKHALVQDAAYGSLLRSHRQRLHARIGEALEAAASTGRPSEPELLARHFEAAADNGKAADYWTRAGTKAASQSADPEAAAHYRSALKAVAELPDTTARLDRTIQLELALGAALMAAEGFAGTGVGEAYGRARKLVAGLPDIPKRIAILNGLWKWSMVRGDMRASQALARECLDLAERTKDNGLLLEGYNAVGVAAVKVGEWETASSYLRRSLQLYDRERYRSHLITFARDPGVNARGYLANAELMMGFPDCGRRGVEANLADAYEINHAMSIGIAQFQALDVYQRLRDFTATAAEAARMQEFGIRYSQPFWLARARVSAAWANGIANSAPDAVAELQASIAAWRGTGAGLAMPQFHTMLGELLMHRGRLDEARELLEDSIAEIDLSLEAESKSELLCVLGDVARRQQDDGGAELWYAQARATALQQKARFFELRAATKIASLWGEQGRGDAARDLLTPICGSFTEGFDTPDLRAARTLLNELA